MEPGRESEGEGLSVEAADVPLTSFRSCGGRRVLGDASETIGH